MYQVLYRKWRPKVFSDVSGQPQVTVTLQNELQSGRIAHAYLFTGSRGTGKTTCAKILAKAVNCLDSQNGDPCGKCEICLGIENGSIMDIVEIDAASNNGVDNIRNLIEESSFTPSVAKYRVYIIDEVHMLSSGAFNALLKTLEEPPSHVIFILATTEVHKLPATILSRCQRFNFNRISPEDIAKRLCFIAEQENFKIDNDAALLIAKIADGALRDALSLLDQCMGKGKNITLDIVNESMGLTNQEHLFSLSNCIIKEDCSGALKIIDELHNSSKSMVRLCEELIDHFRNLMIIKTMNSPENIITASSLEYDNLKKLSDSISLEEILYFIDNLQTSYERMTKGVQQRIEFEMCVVKLCSPKLNNSNEAVLSRISKLESIIKSLSFNENTKVKDVTFDIKNTVKEPTIPKKESNTVVTKPVVDIDNSKDKENNNSDSNVSCENSCCDIDDIQKSAKIMSDWPEVLKVLKGYSKVIANAFNGSTAYVSGNFVLIDAPNSMAFELLRKSAQRDKMRIAIKEVTGKVYKLGPYKQASTEDVEKSDPLKELEKLAFDAGINITKE